MITADEARILMGGPSNEELLEVEEEIKNAAKSGVGFIIKRFDPGRCDLGYIGQTLENLGYVVEIDQTKHGPYFHLIISWTKYDKNRNTEIKGRQ